MLKICHFTGYFLGDIAIPNANYSKRTKEEAALQEELERYKKEVLEGLQIEEEGLTDLLRKKTKQLGNIDIARSHNDPLDDNNLNSIKDHVLKNNFNNLKTDSFHHGIRKRSQIDRSAPANDYFRLDIVRKRHKRTQVTNPQNRNARYRSYIIFSMCF